MRSAEYAVYSVQVSCSQNNVDLAASSSTVSGVFDMFSTDPTRNIDKISASAWPDWDWCKENYRRLDFTQFMSTWVSVSTKGIK